MATSPVDLKYIRQEQVMSIRVSQKKQKNSTFSDFAIIWPKFAFW